MKEEVLKKAIELKNKPDSERQLIKFINCPYMDLRVNIEEMSEPGRILNIDYLLDKDVTEGLKAMIIANFERRINEVLLQIEKL